MTITLTDGATTLTLDPDLFWEDEFAWAPVEQAMEYSLTGRPLIDIGARLAGRPITLRNYDDGSAWMTRADMAQLAAWASVPGQRLTLNLRGTTHLVMFRHHDGGPYSADPVVFYSDAEPTDWVLATVRLMTVLPD